jgi:hypothetical protein
MMFIEFPLDPWFSYRVSQLGLIGSSLCFWAVKDLGKLQHANAKKLWGLRLMVIQPIMGIQSWHTKRKTFRPVTSAGKTRWICTCPISWFYTCCLFCVCVIRLNKTLHINRLSMTVLWLTTSFTQSGTTSVPGHLETWLLFGDAQQFSKFILLTPKF